MRHTLAVLVENNPGVLTRVSGLFSRRGYNIESLAVGVTENPDISRMTIVVRGDDHVLEQVSKQLNKLINVIKVSDVTPDDHVSRELALIKVSAEPHQRAAIMQIADTFRAKIIDLARKSMIIEITGDEKKVDALIQLLREFGLKEVVRTGSIAMVRGPKVVSSKKGEMGDGEGLLRRGCGPGAVAGQEGGRDWLRQPGSCAGSEPKGQRR